MAVANHVRNKTGAKVTSQVNGVASLPTEASANTEDQEEEAQGHQGASTNVSTVGEGEDDKLQDGASDELGEEHAGPGHESSGIGAEDARSGVGSSNSSDAGSLIGVESGLVVGIDDGGTSHGSKNLRNHVDGEFAPWVASEDAIGEGNSWVEMTTGLSTTVDTKHNGQTKQKSQ